MEQFDKLAKVFQPGARMAQTDLSE